MATGPRISIALFLCALLAGCSAGRRDLSKGDIQLAAGDLRTYAYSTQFLIDQCSQENATAKFCWAQSQFLSDKVEDAIRELDGGSHEAEYERKQLEEIGVSLRGIVRRVGNDAIRPSDASDAERLGAISKTLEESLRK